MSSPLVPLEPRGTVLGDEAYTRVGEAIVDGRLAPGERLRDQDLAEWLGISRTPVREALQRLERVGLVEVSPHRYTRVSTPDERTQADTVEFLVQLMGNATRMAAERCDDDTLESLLKGMDAVIAASRADDATGIRQASALYFGRLTRATSNSVIIRLMREAELLIRRNTAEWRPFISCPVGRTAAYEGYRAALAAREGARAEQLLRELHGFV
jgi:DNA-binding GntR family transcriptional regulator